MPSTLQRFLRPLRSMAASLVVLPAVVLGGTWLVVPSFSLHCQRQLAGTGGQAPQGHCRLIRLQAGVVSVQWVSFPLEALQTATVERDTDLDGGVVEQLVVALDRPPQAGGSVPPRRRLAISGRDWRPKTPWLERIQHFLRSRNDSHLSLLLLPIDSASAPYVLLLCLAMPVIRLQLWMQLWLRRLKRGLWRRMWQS